MAITGLSLPNLSATHWLAHTLFLLAVVSGCLSVYYACVLQRTIGQLYNSDELRNWLRLPPSKDENDTMIYASLAAVFIVAAPFSMVKVSIFSFLLGLAVYQGFIWTKALDSMAGRGDSRKVFITFILAMGACGLFFLVTFSTKKIENLLRIGRTNSDYRYSKDVNYSSHQVEQQMPHPVIDEEAAAPPAAHPRHSRSGSDEIMVTDLTSALQSAALAHIQCAEADRRVASNMLRYARADKSLQLDHTRTTNLTFIARMRRTFGSCLNIRS